MAWWVDVVVAIAAGLVLMWLTLLVVLWRSHPDGQTMREALRLVPDVIRLTRRLARDLSLPRGLRVRLWLLLAYLLSPLDLIPDFIPVIGYADDAIIVLLVLRSVLRVAGADAIRSHWPGTPEHLDAVLRLAGQDK